MVLSQISEVVNSMKDLVDLCHEKKVGPIGKVFVFFLAVFDDFIMIILC